MSDHKHIHFNIGVEGINQPNSEYDLMLPKRLKVKAVLDNELNHYLPILDCNDQDRQTRYESFATLNNLTKSMLTTMIGLVFRKPFDEVSLPFHSEYLKERATSYGSDLESIAKEAVRESVSTGFGAFLVDMAKNTIENNQTIKANISLYPALSILDWREVTVDGETYPSYIKLAEVSKVKIGANLSEFQTQIRILEITSEETTLEDFVNGTTTVPAGVYIQKLYNQENILIDTVAPTDANKQNFDRIPFHVFGSEVNTFSLSIPPLLSIAELNILHYIQGADYAESLHLCGQPTWQMKTTFDTEQLKNANPAGFKVGSTNMHNVGDSGAISLVQPNVNQVLDHSMARLEEQIGQQGAKTILNPNANITATATKINNSGSTSLLATISGNISKALTRCAHSVQQFMDTQWATNTSPISIKLNSDFIDEEMSPQLLQSLLLSYDRSIVSKSEIRGILRTNEVLPESSKENDSNIDNGADSLADDLSDDDTE